MEIETVMQIDYITEMLKGVERKMDKLVLVQLNPERCFLSDGDLIIGLLTAILIITSITCVMVCCLLCKKKPVSQKENSYYQELLKI